MRKRGLLVCFLLLFLFVGISYSAEPVVIQFFYYEPCATCPSKREQYEVYVNDCEVVDRMQREYGSKVSIERIYRYSLLAQQEIEQYGIGIGDWNVIVIDYEKVILGYANETYVRGIVDFYLNKSVAASDHDIAIVNVVSSRSVIGIGDRTEISVAVKNVGIEAESFDVKVVCCNDDVNNVYSNESLIGMQSVTNLGPNRHLSMIFSWNTAKLNPGNYTIRAEAEPVANENNTANNVYVCSKIEVTTSTSASPMATFMLAFAFGFFETFSPCLIILLSFLLSYTVSETPYFRESFLKAMVFGAGFILATLVLAVAFGLVFLSMPILQFSLTWAVCIFAIVFGLNLLGILGISSRTPFHSKPLIKKFTKKYAATYGGLFLLGFIFYFLDPCIAPIFVSMMPLLLPEMLLFTLIAFCLGAAIPFVGIGIFAGSVSEIARSTYRHRSRIKAIGGLILIGYASYLIFFYLVPKLIK